MITRRFENYVGMTDAQIPRASKYEKCMFAADAPDFTGGAPTGIRIFPGDDTPRIFVECNLINREPPPGSTLIRCNTALIERDVTPSVTEDEVVEVDGEEVLRRTYVDTVYYGRYVDEGYVYEQSPVVSSTTEVKP